MKALLISKELLKLGIEKCCSGEERNELIDLIEEIDLMPMMSTLNQPSITVPCTPYYKVDPTWTAPENTTTTTTSGYIKTL